MIKLDDISKKMTFVGYDQWSKGYKFDNLDKEKKVINKDVEFNEEEVWDWKVNYGKKYDFLPILDEEEERYEDHQEPIVTPP
jgi:ssDNA-binding replication factor A large subunit